MKIRKQIHDDNHELFALMLIIIISAVRITEFKYCNSGKLILLSDNFKIQYVM